MKTKGLALIIVVGILGVLAVLAAAFVMMAQLERRASEQRVNAARAYLLARSGIEDALARLELGQDSSYGGENWDASPDGLLSSYEAEQEVHRRTGVGTAADIGNCPVRHAMRPSFFAGTPSLLGDNPLPLPLPDPLAGPLPVRLFRNPSVVRVEGRDRGYSGLLSGDAADLGNTYALKASSSNAGIHINGGALDAEDRDPDGPGADASAFPLNPNAADEVAPLKPNGVPDHRDVSMEGPNGFLVRLLNNLDVILTNGATANLGVQVVGARPVGGFKSLDELKPILSQLFVRHPSSSPGLVGSVTDQASSLIGPPGTTRYEIFKPYLTLHAWEDPKVVKPQPMDGRPHRFQDIDDAHRAGAEAQEISGYRLSGGGDVRLNPRQDPPGAGREADPWTQTLTVTNVKEGNPPGSPFTYPVRWERNFVYAWHQLRPAPLALEPRAPVSMNEAAAVVLAAIFRRLKGSCLEVWDGSAGWDGGFGWYGNPGWNQAPQATYAYPSQATEDTPWHRTRVDDGMTCGTPERPWYGPRNYEPHAPPDPSGGGGKPLIQAAPLGRLREITPVSQAQAWAIAGEIRRCVSERGPFRTWEQFGAFVKALPRWEDLNEDGVLDGPPYAVNGSGGTYTRRIYRREDLDINGAMTREVFTVASGSWREGNIRWTDRGTASLAPGDVAGLTFLQKDVLRAMANPNTDLNDFNPDANLWKEVDKTDVAGIGAGPYGPDADAYVHTTELALESAATWMRLESLGRVTGGRGQLLARRGLAASFSLGGVYRDTTQSDFLRASPEGPFAAPYPLAGDQPLLSYPEPQAAWGEGGGAAYDGQLSLGLIGPRPGPDETLRGDLFGTVDLVASGDRAVRDLRGPSRGPILRPAGGEGGQVFPDGVYSEKGRALAYPIAGNFNDDLASGAVFYIACWVKPHWFPEASPRAHALISLSCGGEAAEGYNAYAVPYRHVPVDEIPAHPMGLYFVPARNNAWEETVDAYAHDATSTRGKTWPRRALLWGTMHSLFASDTLNRRWTGASPSPGNDVWGKTWGEIAWTYNSWIAGQSRRAKPMGRLEQHRWQHVAVMGKLDRNAVGPGPGSSVLVLGRKRASGTGGGWNRKFGASGWDRALRSTHADGSENHLRFGEFATATNMNYAADATFANIRAGSRADGAADRGDSPYEPCFTGASGPAALGRYLKEHGAAYTSRKLPGGIRPLRITWTEIPCDLWFDQNEDGWLGDPDQGLTKHLTPEFMDPVTSPVLRAHYDHTPRNDQFGAQVIPGEPTGNGKRDVHIEIEVWDESGRLARFDDPAADNRIPASTGLLPVPQGALPGSGLLPPLPPNLFQQTAKGRIYYKAVFVNEWDAATRLNHPLDVTPFLDDVTIQYVDAAGPRILAYDCSADD